MATWYFLCGPLFLIATLIVYILINRHTYYTHYLDEGNEKLVAIEAKHGHFGHLAIIKKTWKWNLTLFLTMMMLYSVYPALLRLVEPVHHSDFWSQVRAISRLINVEIEHNV